MVYEIRIRGRLGSRWNDWFDHMTVTPHTNGETTLTGPVIDQAELHGLLTRLRDLGLRLVSVMEMDSKQADSGIPEQDSSPSQAISTSRP
jgi:hypothetical protein